MELGNKIKSLRLRAGLTQEMLAEELGVSFQSISKWENSICTPDISMLPKLSVFFGVTIDELFDLTTEQRLNRIEHMLDMEQELPHSTFVETIDFLMEQLDGECDKARIYSFLAHVYHHRIMSDCGKVEKYAHKALRLRPQIKDCQWLLQKASGAAARDFNIKNHYRIISFYKDLVKKNPQASYNYLELIDNLLADNRTQEASDYLKKYAACKDKDDCRIIIYEGRILHAEHNTTAADQKFNELSEKYPDDSTALFALANYYADKCAYKKAIDYYQKSFELDVLKGQKPLYTDALEGMAIIYEIQGQYNEAIKCYERILKVLHEEFNFTEGEPIRIVMDNKQRLSDLMKTE